MVQTAEVGLGAFLRRLKARVGAPKAITATAHKLGRLVYSLLKQPIPKDIFDAVWDDQTAPIPFKDIKVKVVDKSNLQGAIDIGSVTREAMCKGLPAGIGAPCP